ncbi:MAG: endonuclease III [Candidatus Aenigmatarchaeota archaeon]
MASQKEMISTIKILKKNLKKFVDTALTKVSDETRNPFQVLISCILSLRTRDATTSAASERIFKLARTPEAMLKLSIKQIEKAIYPVGFYKTKAIRIKEICTDLIEKFDSKVPDNMDDLLSLKGVGRKTANITLVFGFKRKYHIPVDTHVHKIPNRMGWINTKTPEETEQELMRLIPKSYWMDLNDLLVTFGQNICLPVGPKCFLCPVEKLCKYEKKKFK